MKIKITTGAYNDACTTVDNLTENQMTMPVIRDVLEVAERRMLSTLIVSGPVDQTGVFKSPKQTKIGQVPDGGTIGSNEYRYRIMGRIQRAAVIVGQLGSSASDGTFTLQLQDNLFYPGMIVRFYDGTQARVQDGPTGSYGNYIYFFKTIDASTLDYATSVAAQPGQLTCFGGGTAYGEGSITSADHGWFPDTYVGHLTIQRKTHRMTGDALSQVTWIKNENGDGGWYFTSERQAKDRFMLENEYMKWDMVSTMRDSVGNLLPRSSMTDNLGNQVIAGDGVIPQVDGANNMTPSGASGYPTVDDYQDMMTMLEKNSDDLFDNHWFVVTGTDGFANDQITLADYFVNNLGGRNNNDATTEEIQVGNYFSTFNFGGNSLTLVKNPQWDDVQRYPQRGADGKLCRSGMHLFLNAGLNAEGKKNVEIMAKGANGANRSMISNYFNGMSGMSGKPVISTVDGISLEMLKHDGIFVYKTAACGLMLKPAA